MICNRAEEYSIKVIVREERYTSVKSALDLGHFLITEIRKRIKFQVPANAFEGWLMQLVTVHIG